MHRCNMNENIFIKSCFKLVSSFITLIRRFLGYNKIGKRNYIFNYDEIKLNKFKKNNEYPLVTLVYKFILKIYIHLSLQIFKAINELI